MLLLYIGAVPAGAAGQIAGFLFVPRIMLAAGATGVYWNSDPVTVGLLWVGGIVLDLAGNIMKLSGQRRMMAMWKENMVRGPTAMRTWY